MAKVIISSKWLIYSDAAVCSPVVQCCAKQDDGTLMAQ